jgi:23S rRNA pseudouridine955/2504/2580 synthase/23S rRNA pseudouridine1911/1915/1917 synthase
MERRLRFTISRDKVGGALIAFLGARFPFFSEQDWRDRIARVQVLVNGRETAPDYVLRFADLIEYLGWDVPEPPAPADATIVYRDDDVVGIDKPAGLPCHPGGRYLRNTLTEILRERHGIPAPVLVNRLDRETSGLVVVAMNVESAKELQRQFARRQVSKRYLAFVEGKFPEEVRAEGYLVADPSSVVGKRRRFLDRAARAEPSPAESEPQWAATRFSLVAQFGPVSEVEAVPETGRLHQIRATLFALGFPIVGDKLYGVDPSLFLRFCDGTLTDGDRARLRLGRQALHAASLGLRHPRTGHPLRLEAPLPADLTALRSMKTEGGSR